MEGVHLVHAHTLEARRRGLDDVEQADRLAVCERQDEVLPGADVVEHALGRHRLRVVHAGPP